MSVPAGRVSKPPGALDQCICLVRKAPGWGAVTISASPVAATGLPGHVRRNEPGRAGLGGVSALDPGQTCGTPSAHRIAPAVLVAVTFKALEHIDGLGVAGSRRGGSRIVGSAS